MNEKKKKKNSLGNHNHHPQTPYEVISRLLISILISSNLGSKELHINLWQEF